MYLNSQSIVLITDISTRKAFDLSNILTSNGVEVLLCDDIRGYRAKILSKAYAKDIQLLRKENFERDLTAICERYSDKKLIYFPIEEDTTLCVYKFLENGKVSNFYANLPPEYSFNVVRDKGAFSHFCSKNLLNIPKEYDYESLVASKELPSKLIVKPKKGSGAIGITYIDSKSELLLLDLDFNDYIIQQRIENEKEIEGAFFLFDKGKLVSFYSHKRIRTYPSRGGVSVYSKSYIDENLKKQGTKLLQKLNWSGIAMVEFLYDKQSGDYKIIEVNPRAWGTLMLSEFCNSRLIENYCKSALSQECMYEKADTDKYIRWFFPWDIILYIQSKGKIKDFWKFQRQNCCYINFTYSSWGKALLFTFYNLINPGKIVVFFKKVLQK